MRHPSYDVCVRRTDGTLGVLLRVVRAPNELFVVFALSDGRRNKAGVPFNAHVSWHRNGRFHEKTFGELKAGPTWRGPLTALTAPALVARTPCFQPNALPLRNPTESSTVVLAIPEAALEAPHNGMHFYVEVAQPGSEVNVPPSAEFFERATIADVSPHVIVSAYGMDFRAARRAAVAQRQRARS